jgi:hypothetical protein
MKTKLLLSALLSFVFYLLSSQVPQGFNYQAVARDSTGKPIKNTVLPVRITIQSDSLAGTKFWIEEHNSVTTNSYGLFNIIIGKGVKQFGSTVNTFYDIDWSVTPKFIKTEIDKSGWQNMGSSRLWSVPYSMVAGDLNDTLKKLIVKGRTDIMDEALFEVKNKTGQTLFAVYNEGVRVYVDNGAKGIKGGFAIGGFDKTKDGINQDYFIVNRDSVRVYLDTLSVKTRKGGFAIGGFDRSKGWNGEEYLRVTRDSTRIYVNSSPSKTRKGGFAIGGFSGGKGPGAATPFTSLTPDNYYIGHRSGIKNIGGMYNSFVGFETGLNNVSGSNNVFLGYQAGHNNSGGGNNVFIGNQTGRTNTTNSYNTFLGYQAGYSSNSSYNSFIGYQAGWANTTGEKNTFLGYNSGCQNTTGFYNVFIGSECGKNNVDGHSNVLVGLSSGYSNTSGSVNVFIGRSAGYRNISGGSNVFIGQEAGFGNATGYGNVEIGWSSGQNNKRGWRNLLLGTLTGSALITGDDNSFIGSIVGNNILGGSRNVFIGSYAGYGTYNPNPADTIIVDNVMIGANSGFNLINGNRNVFIGAYSGFFETGSDKLFLDNRQRGDESDARTKALIYGIFDANPAYQSLTINGNVGIGSSSPDQKLDIIAGNGRVQSGYNWLTNSDARFKRNIYTLENCLEKIMAMHGVSFDLNGDSLNCAIGRKNIGFIAQELENIIPEVVVTGIDGYKAVAYDKITAVLTEAIKEQQQQIEKQQIEIDELKTLVNSLIANQTAQVNN